VSTFVLSFLADHRLSVLDTRGLILYCVLHARIQQTQGQDGRLRAHKPSARDQAALCDVQANDVNAKNLELALFLKRLALRALQPCGYLQTLFHSPVSQSTHLAALARMMVQAELLQHPTCSVTP
jgi:hypothetical protein